MAREFGPRSKYRILRLLSIIIFLVLASATVSILSSQPVHAQVQDADQDGALDGFDRCPNTTKGDILPVDKNNPEFLGCSCSQVQAIVSQNKTVEPECVDFICVAGQELVYKLRDISSAQQECAPEYCINYTLYQYPQPGFAKCQNGMQLDYCVPKVTENSTAQCMVIPQGPPEVKMNVTKQPAPWQNTTPANVTAPAKPKSQPSEEDILIREIFDSVNQNDEFRSLFPDGLSRDEFMKGVNDTFRYSIQFTTAEQMNQKVAGKDTTVTVFTVRMTPNIYKAFKDVLIFQRLPDAPGFDEGSLVYDTEPTIRAGRILIWHMKALPDTGAIIQYKVTMKTDLVPDTLIFSEVSTKPLYLQWWAPWILVVAIIVIFYYWFKNEVKKHRHKR